MSPELLPLEETENMVPEGAAGESNVPSGGSWKVKAAGAGAALLAVFAWWNFSIQRSTKPSVEFHAGETAVVSPMPTPRTQETRASAITRSANVATIKVHIAGRVKKPGVYALPSGARVADAVQRAGGAHEDGDINAINLAAWAEDGARIEVPPKQMPQEETLPESVATNAPQSFSYATAKPTKASKAVRSSVAVKSEARSKSTVLPAVKFPIDINRADAKMLEALPGVGPSTAQKILAYREENGGFKSIDDLDEVKGIGPVKLEKMRPFVVVR
jgi:comEA protein